MRIDIDAIEPWDLTLDLGGAPRATRPPNWESVIALEELETAMRPVPGQALPRDLEARLRAGVASFFPADARAFLDDVPYDRLMAAFSAASSYFGAWLKKKQAACTEAAGGRPAGPGHGRASQAAGPRS